MLFRILNNKKEFVATLDIIPNSIIFAEGSNKELSFLISKLINEGAPVRGDIIENGVYTTIEIVVKPQDPSFPYAVRDYLTDLGYDVTEKYPEVEKEIEKLLADFPNDNEDKIDILRRLSEMSYLEMTAILEGLEKLKKN